MEHFIRSPKDSCRVGFFIEYIYEAVQHLGIAPFGPIGPTSSPLFTEKDTSLTALTI